MYSKKVCHHAAHSLHRVGKIFSKLSDERLKALPHGPHGEVPNVGVAHKQAAAPLSKKSRFLEKHHWHKTR